MSLFVKTDFMHQVTTTIPDFMPNTSAKVGTQGNNTENSSSVILYGFDLSEQNTIF